MTVYIGADHGGFRLKEHLKDWLSSQDYHIKDCGAHELVDEDDFPDYAFLVGSAICHDSDTESMGILCCRSGGGMVIAANKMIGIRAVQVFTAPEAVHDREHNNANVLCLGADMMDQTTAEQVVQSFLTTHFTKEDRHVRRLAKISSFEDKDV